MQQHWVTEVGAVLDKKGTRLNALNASLMNAGFAASHAESMPDQSLTSCATLLHNYPRNLFVFEIFKNLNQHMTQT